MRKRFNRHNDAGSLDRVVRQLRDTSNAIENIQQISPDKAMEMAIGTYNRKKQTILKNISPREVLERGYFERPWQILSSKVIHDHFNYSENKKIIDKKMALTKKEFPLLQAVHISRDSFFNKKIDKASTFTKHTLQPAFTSELFYVMSYKRHIYHKEGIMIKICDAKGQMFPKSFYSFQLKKAFVFTCQKLKISNVVRSIYRQGTKYNIVQFEKFGDRTFDVKHSDMKYFEK